MDLTFWIEITIFVVLIGFSGFFSSSETSLFSLGRLQIEQMRRNDNPRVELIERLLSEPRRLIVTILIGNEFVNVAASVISAALVIELLGADSKLFNLLIMIPILLLFGEITPKTLAIRHNVAFATTQSRLIELFAVVIAPLRWVVRLIADWVTTLLVGKERTPGNIVTEDMVRVLAHEAVGEGVLDKNEAQYVDRVFDFGHKTVGDLSTPRSHIFFLPMEMPLSEMLIELRRTRHTKVPVYDGHRDTILGFLYARDLVGVDISALEGDPEAVDKLLREPYLVPESKPVHDLFHTFRRRKLSVALTVDEYGGITGLITMEDLLECIFGDLPSPSDKVRKIEYQQLPDGTAKIPGQMPVSAFNREFASAIQADQAETIAGLLLGEHGELPPEGTSIRLGEYVFEILEIRSNRIESVLVTKARSEADIEQASTESSELAVDVTPGESPAADNGTPADPGQARGGD
jgi:CBS domain containing-hemolysin-like protein